MRIRRFASDVALFAGGSLYDEQDDRFDIAYYWTGEGKGNGQTLTVPAGRSIEGYVYAAAQETEAKNPFSIYGYLQGDERFSGTLSRNTLPRNSILPIALNFSDYTTILSATANISPVAAYPIEIYSEEGSITDNYSIDVPEGSAFTLAVSMQKNGNAIGLKSVKFDYASSNTSSTGWKFGNGLPFTVNAATTSGNAETESLSSASLSGIVSAQPGLATSITIDTETSEGRKGSSTVTLHSKELENFTFPATKAKACRQGNWTMPSWGYLVVPLH